MCAQRYFSFRDRTTDLLPADTGSAAVNTDLPRIAGSEQGVPVVARGAPGAVLALELAAHRPVALVGVLEADPDVLALRLADVDHQLGQLLGELLLLLCGATLVPLDR